MKLTKPERIALSLIAQKIRCEDREAILSLIEKGLVVNTFIFVYDATPEGLKVWEQNKAELRNK